MSRKAPPASARGAAPPPPSRAGPNLSPARSQLAFRAAETAISKAGRPSILSVDDWLAQHRAARPVACKCATGAAASAEAAAGCRLSLEGCARDSSLSPLLPRVFSLASPKGVSCAYDTLPGNFPDDVSDALRRALIYDLELRTTLGGRLGPLAENVRQLFIWHYFGAAHSVMWGRPDNERSPMSPVNDWFEDCDDKPPASARLKTPLAADVSPCPECIGCAARYGGAFDLFLFISGVRSAGRCEHAGGSVVALEVVFVDGARARQAVAEGCISAEDHTCLITYCDALAGLEARAAGIRMELAVETARGCCLNSHFKDTAANTAAVAGVLHAMAAYTTPTKAQAAIVAAAPGGSTSGLIKSALLPFDLDLLSWAGQDVRDGPSMLLPTSAAIAAAARGGAPAPYRAQHLAVCMRAAMEALITARAIERLRRKEVTFRCAEVLRGSYAECKPRLRTVDVHTPPRIAGRLLQELLATLTSSARLRQAPGEAVADSPTGGALMLDGPLRGGAAPPLADHARWEGGLNLAALSSFATAAVVLCGPAPPTRPNVALWVSPPVPLPVMTTPAPVDVLFYTRAASAPPVHPSLTWVTSAFAWFRTLLSVSGFCDPVRHLPAKSDGILLRRLLAMEGVVPPSGSQRPMAPGLDAASCFGDAADDAPPSDDDDDVDEGGSPAVRAALALVADVRARAGYGTAVAVCASCGVAGGPLFVCPCGSSAVCSRACQRAGGCAQPTCGTDAGVAAREASA